MAHTFVPKGQEGLLLRGPLTLGFATPKYGPMIVHPKGEQDGDEGGPRKVAFYTRNNPHPCRVRHIKGLFDDPICSVEDRIHEQQLVSAPGGDDFGNPYCPPGSSRYSANAMKGVPAVGVVPITFAWRDELERKTQNALSKALGQAPPPRSGTRTRNSSRQTDRAQKSEFEHLRDDKLLELLCKILQTDSIPACQSWLAAASESEKGIVLNMIRMAATGQLDSKAAVTRPQTRESQYRYVWTPATSQTKKKTPMRKSREEWDDTGWMGKGYNHSATEEAGNLKSDAPFQFPVNDTVVKRARQLSNQASRQTLRAEKTRSLDLSTFVPRIGSANAERVKHSRIQSQRSHSKSASLSGPMPTGIANPATLKPRSVRPRTRSATLTPISRSLKSDTYPPPPVRISVSREELHRGTPGGEPRRRYTSHWDT